MAISFYHSDVPSDVQDQIWAPSVLICLAMADQFRSKATVLHEISLSSPNNCDLGWSVQSFAGARTLEDSANH